MEYVIAGVAVAAVAFFIYKQVSKPKKASPPTNNVPIKDRGEDFPGRPGAPGGKEVE